MIYFMMGVIVGTFLGVAFAPALVKMYSLYIKPLAEKLFTKK